MSGVRLTVASVVLRMGMAIEQQWLRLTRHLTEAAVDCDADEEAHVRSRNASIGVVDQATSSATNFLLVILVARVSTTTEFGQVALAIAWCQLALGMGQEAISQTHLVHGATSLEEARGALGASMAVGAVMAVPGLLILAALGSGWPEYAMLACLPLLLLQDCLRFVFVREGLATKAVLSDLTWLLVLAGMALVGGASSAPRAVVAWLVGAFAATLVALALARVMPSLRVAQHWHDRHAAVVWRNAFEYGLLSGASQITMVLVGKLATVAAVGALRATSTIFGPINVILMSLRLVLLPRLACISLGRPQIGAGRGSERGRYLPGLDGARPLATDVCRGGASWRHLAVS